MPPYYVRCRYDKDHKLTSHEFSRTDDFRQHLLDMGWARDGDNWTCPACQQDAESEHIEYALMNFSCGDGVLILPNGMTTEDWDDLCERMQALRVVSGVK